MVTDTASTIVSVSANEDRITSVTSKSSRASRPSKMTLLSACSWLDLRRTALWIPLSLNKRHYSYFEK